MKFGNWKDRLAYLLAEAQLLVIGLMFSVGVLIIWLRPSVPGIPPIVHGWFAALMLFGPPLFGLFVTGARKLRNRNMVEVYHVNAVTDELRKYYVEPSVWGEKAVEGPNPYPVNGGSAWCVQEFDWLEDVEELRVKGVWLEETQDTKLYTSKSHMESIYEKLTESHIALQILRDSVSEFGADIQRKLINSMAEARERGRMMDQTAIKTVFEDFEDSASGLGADDLPTLEPDEIPGEDFGGLADDALEDTNPLADVDSGPQQPAATDGGQE